MNPNDVTAQYQAMVNQAMQNQQQWMWVNNAIQITLLIIIAWVIYMFYARLRDIAEELMKLRVAYQFANPPKPDTSRPPTPAGSAENPFKPGDARYQPK